MQNDPSVKTNDMRAPRAQFRLSGDGYDREDVEVFVRDVEHMVARWQTHAASLEAAALHYQQYRLIAGRTRQRLETSLASTMSALQELQEILRALEAGQSPATANISPAVDRRADDNLNPVATVAHAILTQIRKWCSHRPLRRSLYTGGASFIAIVALLAVIGMPVWSRRAPTSLEAQPRAATQAAPAVAAAAGGTSGIVAPTERLTVSVVARAHCRIRAIVDGEAPVEYSLQRNDTVTFTAAGEVVLRTDNAAALSLMINGRAAAPLGRPNEAVTTRITPTYTSSAASDR